MTLTGKQYFLSLLIAAVIGALIAGFLVYSHNERKIAQAEETIIGLEIQDSILLEHYYHIAGDSIPALNKYIASLEEQIQFQFADTTKQHQVHENHLLIIHSLPASDQLGLFARNFARQDPLYYHR